MNKQTIAVAVWVGALALGATPMVQAQRFVVSSTPPKQISRTEFAENLKHRLESMGYAGVTLTPSDKGITGTAKKGDRKVDIIFDDKGQLHVR